MGFTPQRKHGFYVLVMVIGWVLPPIAVLLRFGFGTDFLINIILTIAGYIPGHGHNFYLQNIRNNENRKRTPQWASRAGLVKDPTIKRKKRTQWANRYDERTPTRADGYQDDDLATQSNQIQPKRSSLDLENDHHHRNSRQQSNSTPSITLSISESSSSSSADSIITDRPRRREEDLEARDLDKFPNTTNSPRNRSSRQSNTNSRKDRGSTIASNQSNRDSLIRRSRSIGPNQDRSRSNRSSNNLSHDPYRIEDDHSQPDLSRRISINSISNHSENRKSLGQKLGLKKKPSENRHRNRDDKQWSVGSDPRLKKFEDDEGLIGRRSLPVVNDGDGLDHTF